MYIIIKTTDEEKMAIEIEKIVSIYEEDEETVIEYNKGHDIINLYISEPIEKFVKRINEIINLSKIEFSYPLNDYYIPYVTSIGDGSNL